MEEPSFNFKEMERVRAFLTHLGRTYPGIMSRLKGLNHMLDSWRGKRHSDGWKF